MRSFKPPISKRISVEDVWGYLRRTFLVTWVASFLTLTAILFLVMSERYTQYALYALMGEVCCLMLLVWLILRIYARTHAYISRLFDMLRSAERSRDELLAVKEGRHDVAPHAKDERQDPDDAKPTIH